jgi:hypothetical protein
MRKYLVAAVLIGAFSAPAFAEEIYVAFDPASHKCTMMHSQPASGMKVMGHLQVRGRGQGGHGENEGLRGLVILTELASGEAGALPASPVYCR